MKKLLTILMSLQLIVAPVAFAQSSSDKNAGEQFRSGTSGGGGAGMGDMIEMIAGMGTSIVGMNALFSCKLGFKKPSILLLTAGSTVHMLSEILGGKAHNDYLKRQTESLRMVEEKMKNGGSGGEVQKETLEKALANEKAILSFINKRKMWTALVMATYAGGMVASIMELPTDIVPAACDPVSGILKDKLTVVAISTAYGFASGGISSALMTGLTMFILSKGGAQKLLLNTAKSRLIYFGVVTAIQAYVMSSLSKKAGVAKENIAKLEKAIKEWKATTSSTTTLAEDNSLDPNKNGAAELGDASKIKALGAAGNVSRLCASGNAQQGVDVSSKACANPLRLQAPQFDGKLQVPTLASFSNGVTEVANQLSAGNLDAAEVGAGNLAAQAARMNLLKENAIKKMNADLKAQGKKPIDVNAEVKSQLAAMSDGFKSSNPELSKAFAAMANGQEAMLADDLKGEGDLKGATQDLKAAEIQAEKKGEETATPNSMLGGIEPTTGFEQVDESAKVNELMKSDEFEFANEDVRKDKDTSLFQMVSSRYILNYNRFFKKAGPETEEKKTPEPAPAPK